MAGGVGFGKFINTMLLRVDLINKSFYLVLDDKIDKKKKADSNNDPNNKAQDGDDGDKKSRIKNLEMSELDKMSESKEKTKRPLIGGGKEEVLHKINKNGQTSNDKPDRVNSIKFDDYPEENKNADEKSELKEENHENTHEGRGANISNRFWNDPVLILPNKIKKFEKFKMSFTELIFQKLPFCSGNKELMKKKKIFEECGSIIESFFDIERIVGILREYQELRNVVLSHEEYKILKQLTTPKIEVTEDDVNIKKVSKFQENEKELKKNYSKFVQSINRLIKMPYLTPIESNLLEIHRLSVLMKDEPEPKKENI
jgi:hypothetical protein